MNWYDTLTKPNFTPPGSLIGAVWTVIYVLMAAFSIYFWNKAKRDKLFWEVIVLLVLNALLNVGWSYFFFYRQMIVGAFIEMIVLALSILLIIILATKKVGKVTWLIYPYLVWASFATFLTWRIIQLN